MMQDTEVKRETKTICTHQNIDLDAVCSVWLWNRFKDQSSKVIFKPADWSTEDKNVILLDMPAGIKNNKQAGYFSCFGALLHQFEIDKIITEEEISYLKNLLQLVEVIERGKEPTNALTDQMNVNSNNLNVIREHLLPNILRCLQRTHNDDYVVINRMFEILDGGFKIQKTRNEIRKQFRDPTSIMNSMIHEFGAVTLYRGSARINGKLFSKGSKIIVFSNGNNLGAVREMSYTIIALDDPRLVE